MHAEPLADRGERQALSLPQQHDLAVARLARLVVRLRSGELAEVLRR